jgi:glycosyltransferase involved in cell wall biosynthesis
MSPEPLISVVMCTYNGGRFVEQAVADIQAQSYPNWELVISDDGSTDGTRDLLSALPKDKRIRIIFQPENVGYVHNKNFAIGQARGELITQQDQDDRSDPERLKRQLSALQSSGLEIAACGYRRLDSKGRTLFEVAPPAETIMDAKPEGDYPFWFPSMLVSRRVYDEMGLFSTYFAGVFGDDLYWTVRTNQRCPIICLPDILYGYTDAPASITSLFDNPRKLVMSEILAALIAQRRSTGTDDLEEGRIDALQAMEDRLLADRAFLGRRYQMYAARSIDQGRLADAQSLLRKSFALRPLQPELIQTALYYMRTSLHRRLAIGKTKE